MRFLTITSLILTAAALSLTAPPSLASGGQIPGYQDAAYWNQRTHRVVVLVTTLWPGATPATSALVGRAYDDALCRPTT